MRSPGRPRTLLGCECGLVGAVMQQRAFGACCTRVACLRTCPSDTGSDEERPSCCLLVKACEVEQAAGAGRQGVEKRVASGAILRVASRVWPRRRVKPWAPDAAERLLLVRWHWRWVRAGQSARRRVDAMAGPPPAGRGLERASGSDFNLIDEAGHGRARFDGSQRVLGRNDHLLVRSATANARRLVVAPQRSGPEIPTGAGPRAASVGPAPCRLRRVGMLAEEAASRAIGQAFLDVEFVEAAVGATARRRSVRDGIRRRRFVTSRWLAPPGCERDPPTWAATTVIPANRLLGWHRVTTG